MSKLKAPFGRVVVSVDLEGKNSHTFSDGTKIRLERNYNNLNRRETAPVNAIVLASDYIPEGSEILISHNSTHDVNRLFNFTSLSGESEASDIKYYSLPDSECFVYREPNSNEWMPCKGYAIGLRIFKPYNGILQNIEPTLIKNKLFITSGELKNKVVLTLKACDYQIVFQDINGQEGNLIRCRHYENVGVPTISSMKGKINMDMIHCNNGEDGGREEIVAIDENMTNMVLNGELLVGITISDSKKVV